jgi:MFS superfamily sulfate permease-like transporter
MKESRLSNVRDDLLGGLVSVALAIPLAVGYGMPLSVTNILPTAHLLVFTLQPWSASFALCLATAARRFTHHA